MKAKLVTTVLIFILVGLIAMAFALSGCGAAQPGAPAEAPKAPAPAKPEVKVIRWGSSAVGTSGYNLSAKIGELINKSTTYEVNVNPTGGTEATVRSLTRGERDIGIGNTHAVYDGYNGVGTFAKEGKQPISLLAMTYTSALTLVAQPGIAGVPDFKGKTVTYRQAANPLFGVFGDAVLRAHGLDPDKDVKNVLTGESRVTIEGLKTGTIDAGLLPGAIPGASIPELLEARTFTIIDVGKDKVEAISKQSPFMTPFPIKANTFKGQSKDVDTLGFVIVIFARADIPDKMAYDVTKTIYSNLTELASADPSARGIKLENAAKNPIIPLHPGAAQYYKEVGALK